MGNSSKGSLWRKWDLHVHTPHSHLHQNFGKDFDSYAKQLFRRAVANDIWVIGITDYFTIDGYKELRSLLNDEDRLLNVCDDKPETVRRVKGIRFLPNIEFRLSTLVGDSRVNFHVIFSDELSVEDIEENFLHELDCLYAGSPQDTDTTLKLRLRNIERLGQRLKNEHEQFQGESDLTVGMMNAVVDHSQISKVLQTKGTLFRGQYLLGLPCDEDLSKLSWDGQDHHVRKVLVQKSDFLFAANPNTVAWALGRKSSSLESHINEFKSRKPCFASSDAHDFETMFVPSEGRQTWIKADTTFKGLWQVLNEPEHRVFIGRRPPIFDRVRINPTRYIKSVCIRKVGGSSFDEHWFKSEIDLNFGMVAIIGNKGSGKSALADIIGLVGNSTLEKHFSFLNADKFRRPKHNKAMHFECFLTWQSGEVSDARNLAIPTQPEEVERIKYIPQSYLEKICSDIGTARDTGFQHELETAIFSGLMESDRLGHGTLQALIKFSSEEINRKILLLKSELQNSIDALIDCNDKSAPEYRKELEKQILQLELELKSAKSTRPKDVQEPPVQEATSQLNKDIRLAREEVARVEEDFNKLQRQLSELKIQLAICKKLTAAAENIEGHFQTSRTEMVGYCAELNLDVDELVTLKIDDEQILAKQQEIESIIEETEKQLDPDIDKTTADKKTQAESSLRTLLVKLEGPEKKYQHNLKELAEWQTRCNSIEGDLDTKGSLVFLRNELTELDRLGKEHQVSKDSCISKSVEIFAEILQKKEMYEAFHQPIQESVDRHKLVQKNLAFSVAITPTEFHSSFLNYIDQSRKGSFNGVESGSLLLKGILDESDFESADGIEHFLDRLLNAISSYSSGDDETITLSHPKNQLRKSSTLKQLYDYIFGLEYLVPQYALLWQGKQVDQLSPGERGTLLLIFYLLVDKENCPLLIDQPEENLDNQTVFNVLVDAIKEAKCRRQIIIVTHNPNLAVVCDAEQIIYAAMDKEKGNAVEYVTGAIENARINKHLLDVLEGTRPAFHNRDSKYRPFDDQFYR